MPTLKEVPKEYTIEYAIAELNKNGRLIKILQLAGVPIGQHFTIDYYRRSIILMLPVPGGEIHEIVWHFSSRKWATPPSKVYKSKDGRDHFHTAVNAARRFFKGMKRRNVKNRTYFLVCASHTKSVKPQYKRHGGESVFIDTYKLGDDWIQRSVKRLLILFFRRRDGSAKRSLEKHVRPYGGLKEDLDKWKFLIEAFKLLFEGIPPHLVAQRLAGKS